MAPPRFPARLHVLLAQDAPLGLVFRRGPSKSVCTFLWDLKTDRFKLGQWLRGRIYERRADLSPDGKHLIYFAMNGRWTSETGGSWTAISKAPWLKAKVLLGKGDCWHGGGLFTGDRWYWLNDGYGHKPLKTCSDYRRDPNWKADLSFGGECPGVYYVRLQRDGWTLVSTRDGLTVFEKPLYRGWTLRKLAHEEISHPPGRGCYWDEHELVHEDGRLERRPDWEWAELDGRDLVWAEKGALRRAAVSAREVHREPKLLRDFNADRFEAIAAPY